jgi:rhodanese-related sulfurtransferase
MNILNSLFGNKEDSNYKELVKQGAIILDVRSKDEFASGHVKGAINIPLNELASNLTKLGDKDSYIITCCMSGGRSSMAKSILHNAGYNNVHNGGGWHSLQSKLS